MKGFFYFIKAIDTCDDAKQYHDLFIEHDDNFNILSPRFPPGVEKVSDHGTNGPRKKFKFPENIFQGRTKFL